MIGETEPGSGPEKVLHADVQRAIHTFMLREMEQWENINAQKPRTDSGYLANLRMSADQIIELIRKHVHGE